MTKQDSKMKFDTLVSTIFELNKHFTSRTTKAVNINLTLRNWFIGAYIAEYELNGEDRAVYGEALLDSLATRLQNRVSSTGRRQLYNYLRFYRTYPGIVRSLPAQLRKSLPFSLPQKKVRSATAQLQVAPEELIGQLSYTHIEQLTAIEDSLKRAFYEIECIRANWTVKELKRQINSLYYERSGLSKNKEKLGELVRSGAQKTDSKLVIRDPYVFEFLGIKPQEVMSESDLEDALLDKLQEFLLELGHGFCFEARQKRILIGDTNFFIDLVFYHRILKCHVLIDLKVEEFTHENIGQLNTYVSWYRENMMQKGDYPPVGILLCTNKNSSLVEYALAGMDNNLFVSRYKLELPSKEEMKRFLEENLKLREDQK